MLRNLFRPAIVLTLALCLLTGGLYPGVVTGLAQLLFPHQANGSLIAVDGRVVGSELIGQGFSAAGYFHSRPSAAGAGYDAAASGGSNRGPTDRKLADTLLAGAIARAEALHGAKRGRIPADLVTASASGLDPHLSPASALLQVPRVARERGVDEARVHALVEAAIEGRQLGFLGEPRVNVLRLNLTLEREFGRAAAREPTTTREDSTGP